MSHLICAMLIENSETKVEEYYSGIPVSKHVAKYWTPAYVLYMWCFNGNINYSRYFRSCKRFSLTTKLQV